MSFTYTIGYVESVLETYPYVREGMGYPPEGEAVVYLDQSGSGAPFGEKKHAAPIRDGKKKARATEDTICAVFDLECAFPRLSDESRGLLSLVYIRGYSYAEVASMMKLSENSVSLRVRSALNELCKLLNGE